MEGTSLEQFRKKHGQAAYNTLIKSIEGMKKAPAGMPDQRSLSALTSKIMARSQNALANTKIPRVRGSADVPLNEEGQQEALTRAQQLAGKGGLDHIITSNLQRSRDTGVMLAKHTGATLQTDDHVMPWKLGMFEGEPVEKVKDYIAKLANDHPDVAAPGKSPVSTHPGESFNDFKGRWIGKFLAPLMEQFAQDPRGKIGIVTHLRDVLAAKSWIEKGTRRDLQFDHHDVNYESKTDKEEQPGSVFRIYPNGDKWAMEDMNKKLDDASPLEHGIYLIRHGKTDWNSPEKNDAGGPS